MSHLSKDLKTSTYTSKCMFLCAKRTINFLEKTEHFIRSIIMQHVYNCNNGTILLHNHMLQLHSCTIVALCDHLCILCTNISTQAHDSAKLTDFLQKMYYVLMLCNEHMTCGIACFCCNVHMSEVSAGSRAPSLFSLSQARQRHISLILMYVNIDIIA